MYVDYRMMIKPQTVQSIRILRFDRLMALARTHLQGAQMRVLCAERSRRHRFKDSSRLLYGQLVQSNQCLFSKMWQCTYPMKRMHQAVS